MSSCKFPNHLCHLLHMPRANIPVWYCSKNITHIVLSHIHVLIHLASFQRPEPFQPDCGKLPRTLTFLCLGSHLGFEEETSECTGKLMRWPGSRAHPSLPARCTVSGPSIKRSTNQGNKTKAWHRRCVTAYDHVARDTAPLSARWACSSVPGEWERMQAMLGGRRIRRKGPQRIPEQTGSKW